MNVISAYLTRQVNGGGGGKEEFTRDFLDRLKNAVLLGDLDGFVETMHVIITPESRLNIFITHIQQKDMWRVGIQRQAE